MIEFRLNKVDPDIRQKINDKRKEGKIHSSNSEILVDKDKDHKEDRSNSFKEEFKKQNKKNTNNTNNKKITIDAVKAENVSVEAVNEEKNLYNTVRGLYLDIRK